MGSRRHRGPHPADEHLFSNEAPPIRRESSAMAAQPLVIDGLNVITTIEVALAGGVLLLGRDACMRDMASFHGSYRLVQETERAVAILVDVVESMRPSEAMVYIDRPVSTSGRLAEIVRAAARSWMNAATR